MQGRLLLSFVTAVACVLPASCSEPEIEAAAPEVLGSDPLLARALNDPLMVDPDLSWRNEANAVIAIRDGHPLPPFDARDDSRQRARDAARLELLENGQIPALPPASGGQGKASLAKLTTADEIIRAVGSRGDCIDDLTADITWSTGLPPTSSVMPHGMVRQAAGVDQGSCVIRVVRYLTPVAPEDALEYHFAKADRARFRIERFAAPEAQLRAERRDQEIAVHVRPGPGGMTAVDVVHWRK